MKYRKNHNSGPHRRVFDMKMINYKIKIIDGFNVEKPQL